MEAKKIKVVVNGLPGKMALAVANGVASSEDMYLLPFGLTGPEVRMEGTVAGGQPFRLFKPHEKYLLLERFVKSNRPDIVVDFTGPSAVQQNVDFYVENALPFVMGTTFGEFTHLHGYIRDAVAQTLINAVVAPNMAKDVVLLQTMFEWAARNFPNALAGFSGKPVESHQKTKADTSGTAKAIVACLQKLGVDCSVEEIKKIRAEEVYEVMNIPKEHWEGHGWHTYPLTKNDSNVFLSFTHNINGRQPYVDGTLDAVRFLHAKMDPAKRNVGNVFSMIDILHEWHAK